MSLRNLASEITEAPFFDAVAAWTQDLSPEMPESLQCKGVLGSLPSFVIQRLGTDQERPLVCLLGNAESAAYLMSDLSQLLEDPDRLLLFPPSAHKPYDDEQMIDPGPLIQRADVLQRLGDGFAGVVVTSIEAVFEMVPPPETVKHETFTISIGQVIDPTDLLERLVGHGFERVEFVESPGELALRGGILDVFPFAGDYPLRLEFFGDELDSIREFDIHSQRSISRQSTARIVPNLERASAERVTHLPLFDYLPADSLLAVFDEAALADQADALYEHAEAAFARHTPDEQARHLAPPQRYLDGDKLRLAFLTHPRLLFGSFVEAHADRTLTLDARPQPDFNGNMKLLRQRLGENNRKGLRTIILCDSRGQEARLFELLEEDLERGLVTLQVDSLHEGFELPELGLALYTDHQIFNRYHRPTARKLKAKHGGISLRELRNLSPGDFVVHVDYGIGKFAGMKRIEVRGKQQEAVKLHYRDNDVLYVNVNALYKLHKYTGKEGHQPRLTKLGTGQWERVKARTKSRVKDIARDLIKLYAKRKQSDGHAFSRDTIWQRELEASFQFEDTPDQATAAEAVKTDMESPVPMDRLVCGDVGFGKTEIAVRAAFKSVQDGKQVAILVPTTVLAAQHYRTFMERMRAFPVNIEVLSRFRPSDELKQAIVNIKTGKADIVVGTHRLLSKDVQFKDLGLLIVDEEQRFGVAVKEKLRQMRVDVDTLTLTATPIPRTLQFSLLGARDLSIIATAPPNRQPIVTEIHTFDKNLIRDAILYETSRGGQVFFIHNRVQSIDEMAATLRAIVPGIRMQVAHGQMKGPQLERVMLDFIDKKFDVLVSTSIIENGLDISNANTIIIDRADRFGLAEIHQLRGRVGRSNRKAFCYLMVPSIHGLTREAKQRLQAVEEFSDLGSGFHLAMRDLDIRGAGNMLGAEQSGFIEDVGYETYHRILDEAVHELRETEFADVFDTPAAPRPGETAIDVEADALIPEHYLANNLERLNLYRRISAAEDVGALANLADELTDRFGAPPEEVANLLFAAEIKLRAQSLRLPKVMFKNERLFLELPLPDEDSHFQETIFKPLLARLAALERRYVLKETGTKKKKLRAIIQDVPDLEAALAVMEKLGDVSEAVAG